MLPLVRLPLSPLVEATGAARDRALARAPQAEWGLAHQGARVLLTRDQASGWLVRRAGRRLVALGLPLGAAPLTELHRAAAAQGLSPLLYKCDAATAAVARARGWRVLRLGHEAILDLAHWATERPACRQLRRKLRAPAVARLRITEAEGDLPLARMTLLARDWEAQRGGERGFSMGRLDRRLLRRQRVLLAWEGETLVAFASFHATRSEWTLDLMRHGPAAPGGTMHRLLAEAAALARAEGALRLSLAGLPDPALPRPRFPGEAGLRQFKLAFGPRLSPRYAAAPGSLSLGAGLLRVAWAIRWPEPLPEVAGAWEPATPEAAPMAPAPFGFEPAPVPCDARGACPSLPGAWPPRRDGLSRPGGSDP